ncbi:hypothetical protein [uncultured Winogradskyella sp.]|uniref:hypothetical protein n=1 Tax=uncultured Winogradskyella sp. TaxID=395353 RepID=UPI00260C94EB|nr:hypothetical protein [uncultured Winogradskyella sp.]
MRYLSLLIVALLFSCKNERVIQLPEIENADIKEVLDVSPAYVFYDQTQPDSTLFNRKNLISTTNWLVNVDKRLTLKQAIPHLQYLQNKRRKASMHKNENAKNYFTSNDTSIKNLGFLEFTDVNYIEEESTHFYLKTSQLYLNKTFLHLRINSNKKVNFIRIGKDKNLKNKIIRYSDLNNYLIKIKKESKNLLVVCLNFNKELIFQDYISIKSELSKLNIDEIIIDGNEFFY